MSKAETWLRKYGWEPGKGLGLNESGDSKPLPLARKEDTLGVGAGEQWANDWWTRAYDHALKGFSPDDADAKTDPRDKESQTQQKETQETLEKILPGHTAIRKEGLWRGSFVQSKTIFSMFVPEYDPSQDDGREEQEQQKRVEREESIVETRTEEVVGSSKTIATHEEFFKISEESLFGKFIPKGKLARLALQDKSFSSGAPLIQPRASEERKDKSDRKKKKKQKKDKKKDKKKKRSSDDEERKRKRSKV